MSFTGKLLSVAALSSLAASAAIAQSLPPSVAACASEKDSLARLVCFDREVAKYSQPTARVAPPPTPSPSVAAPARPVAATPPVVASPNHDDFGTNALVERKRDEGKKPEERAPNEMRAVISKLGAKPY